MCAFVMRLSENVYSFGVLFRFLQYILAKTNDRMKDEETLVTNPCPIKKKADLIVPACLQSTIAFLDYCQV